MVQLVKQLKKELKQIEKGVAPHECTHSQPVLRVHDAQSQLDLLKQRMGEMIQMASAESSLVVSSAGILVVKATATEDFAQEAQAAEAQTFEAFAQVSE